MEELEHYVGQYPAMLVHAYNPDRYVGLMELGWRRYVKFFVLTLLLSLFLFLATFLPLALIYVSSLPETLTHVETFEVSAEIHADGPIEILHAPLVLLDLNGSLEETEASLLFTQEGMRYPGPFGGTIVRWTELSDLKTPTSARDHVLYLVVLFLLPSIIFWVAIGSLLELFLVFVALVVLGALIPRWCKHRIRFSEVVKVAILAMPSVMLFGVGLSPLAPGPLFWWGLLVTVIVFAIGIVLLSERITHAHHEKAKYK